MKWYEITVYDKFRPPGFRKKKKAFRYWVRAINRKKAKNRVRAEHGGYIARAAVKPNRYVIE